MPLCSLCHEEVKGNVNSSKILTCGLCVQKLLLSSREVKIATKNKLLERNDFEGARSIETFIVDEETEPVRVSGQGQKATRLYRGFRRVKLHSTGST